MSFMSGPSGDSYKPVVNGNTTAASYWLNWRVLLCALWILFSAVFSLLLIWRHERFFNHRRRNTAEEEEESEEAEEDEDEETAGFLYDDETWSPCLKGVHPGWLLGFRAFAFLVLLGMLVLTALIDDWTIFYYYTQWTFTLITIYFGLGTLLSIYGCYEYHNRLSGDKVDNVDSERGGLAAPQLADISNTFNIIKKSVPHQNGRKSAGFWGYLFQIIFQMNAGAVVLTDCVFWFIIVPFLAINNYNLSFLDINMHTINVVLLIGDTALNCLRFPVFRIGYFFLWTIAFVIFQWLLHACITIWWPYPFLDLSSQFAPLWYISVALMHFPCYGIFMLVIKLKHYLLTKWFPQSYQCPR